MFTHLKTQFQEVLSALRLAGAPFQCRGRGARENNNASLLSGNGNDGSRYSPPNGNGNLACQQKPVDGKNVSPHHYGNGNVSRGKNGHGNCSNLPRRRDVNGNGKCLRNGDGKSYSLPDGSICSLLHRTGSYNAREPPRGPGNYSCSLTHVDGRSGAGHGNSCCCLQPGDEKTFLSQLFMAVKKKNGASGPDDQLTDTPLR